MKNGLTILNLGIIYLFKKKKRQANKTLDLNKLFIFFLLKRLKVHKETKMYVSLMLEDRKLSKQEYVQCNYMLIRNKMKNNRIWERPT